MWDPFWFDPWWGWDAPGPYGYYGYAPPYSYPDQGYYPPDDNSNPPPEQYNQNEVYPENDNNSGSNGNWVTPNGPSPVQMPSSGAMAVPILIYMKNGSALTVRDYWMIDGELHYLQMNGVERTADLETVDLPRTNTENAKSGVRFIFKSEPSVPASAPPSAQPNFQPGSPSSPAPTQQINATPQSQSRT